MTSNKILASLALTVIGISGIFTAFSSVEVAAASCVNGQIVTIEAAAGPVTVDLLAEGVVSWDTATNRQLNVVSHAPNAFAVTPTTGTDALLDIATTATTDSGVETVTFTVADGIPASAATCAVDIEIVSAVPVANAATIGVANEGGAFTTPSLTDYVTLPASCSNPTFATTLGTVNLADNTVLFDPVDEATISALPDPNASTTGTFTFDYTVTCPGGTDTNTITVNVNAGVQAITDSRTYNINNVVGFQDYPSVMLNDIDLVNGVTIDVPTFANFEVNKVGTNLADAWAATDGTLTATTTGGGTVTMNVDGTFTYFPPAGVTATSPNDSFVYAISSTDGTFGNLLSYGTVVISFNDDPLPPDAIDDGIITVFENTPEVIDVLANDLDGTGAPIDPADVTVTVTTPPTFAGSTATVNTDGTITYTSGPTAADYFDTFEYQICLVVDPTACDTATVSLDVINEITEPFIRWDQNPFEVLEGSDINLTGTLVDPDNIASDNTVDIYLGDFNNSNNMIGTATADPATGVFSFTYSPMDELRDDISPDSPEFFIYELWGVTTDARNGFTDLVIYNVTPEITSSTFSDTMINVDESVTVEMTFRDPGVFDSKTVAINWGDNSTPVILSYNGDGTTTDYMVPEQMYTYTMPGTYRIVITVSDDDGGITMLERTVTVRALGEDADEDSDDEDSDDEDSDDEDSDDKKELAKTGTNVPALGFVTTSLVSLIGAAVSIATKRFTL